MNDGQMIGAQMDGGDEIGELTRLLPPPPAPDLPAGRAWALRTHLVAEVAGTRPGPRHRPAVSRFRRPGWRAGGLTGAVAVGAAAAVAVSVLLPGGHGGGASPAAATLLAKIADTAARQPAPKVSDSEFVYVRSQVAFRVDSIVNGHDTVTMDKPHERQVWLPVDSTCDGLLIEHGSRTALSPSSATAYESTGNGPAKRISPQCGGSVNDPTYRFLQSLPTDPRKLLDFVYDKTQGEGQAQGRDGEAFITIGDMIRESIVPPQTAAALYRAAALIPGVSVVPHATNAAGRPGVAVAWTGGSGHQTYEWIFDAKTYQFIGEQDTSGATAILQQAFVAHAGQLPPKASQ
jgi:hypothetical protein